MEHYYLVGDFTGVAASKWHMTLHHMEQKLLDDFHFVFFFLSIFLGLLNESHPRVFQTITLSFFIAFKARQG